MKYILTIICAVICLFTCQAQSNEAAALIMQESAAMQDQVMKLSTAITKSRNHNLYLNKTWQNGAVVTKDQQVAYFNGRFNVLDNSIELKNKNGIRSIRANRVKAAMIGDRIFISVPKDQIKQQANTSFYEVISLGKINLYVKHFLKSRMTGSNTLTTGYNGEKEYFIDEELHYHGNGMLCQKLKGKKKILELFGTLRGEVEAYAKDQSLKYKAKEDLIRIFDFYNSLAK